MQATPKHRNSNDLVSLELEEVKQECADLSKLLSSTKDEFAKYKIDMQNASDTRIQQLQEEQKQSLSCMMEKAAKARQKQAVIYDSEKANLARRERELFSQCEELGNENRALHDKLNSASFEITELQTQCSAMAEALESSRSNFEQYKEHTQSRSSDAFEKLQEEHRVKLSKLALKAVRVLC